MNSDADSPAAPKPRRIEQRPALPPRPLNSHKGTFGTVLIIGGSRGMAGAAALSGMAALRAGAGLVRIACPQEIMATVAGFEPSYMTRGLAQDQDGRLLDQPNRETLQTLVRSASVVAIGPGLGQSDEVRSLVHWLWTSLPQPAIFDADALNALASGWGAASSLALVSAPAPRIITPHPGEFARLTGLSVSEIQRDRETIAVSQAARVPDGRLVILLKGQGSVITDGDRVWINSTGNPGLATGGSGDVLTGALAALAAQGLPPFEAAALAAWAHGRAGDLAREDYGELGLIASDLPRYLGIALR